MILWKEAGPANSEEGCMLLGDSYLRATAPDNRHPDAIVVGNWIFEHCRFAVGLIEFINYSLSVFIFSYSQEKL